MVFKKGQTSKFKGKTYEEIYGEDRAKIEKENRGKSISETHKKDFASGKRVAWSKGLTKEDYPNLSNSGSKKGSIPWNKNKKGLQKAWNKGLKGEEYLNHFKNNKIWSKGLTKEVNESIKRISESKLNHEVSIDTRKKIKKSRAKQVLPKKDTSIELKIQDFLTLLKIEFLTHKYMNIKHAYQCDILIPVQKGILQKTIIECDGDFFHMNPNKFSPEDKIFKNGITAKEKWEIDDSRTKELINKGFKVLRLWEKEIRIMGLEDFKLKIQGVGNEI